MDEKRKLVELLYKCPEMRMMSCSEVDRIAAFIVSNKEAETKDIPAEKMKGISCCGDCAFYSRKKHKCTRNVHIEPKANEHFYADCPLPDVCRYNT